MAIPIFASVIAGATSSSKGGRIVSAAFGGTFGNTGLSTDAFCYLTFQTDGSCDKFTIVPGTEDWATGQPITGYGTGVHVRLRTTSGTLSYSASLSAGTWYEITSARVFGVQRLTGEGVGTNTWDGDIDFSLDGGTTTIWTSSLTINATYDVL